VYLEKGEAAPIQMSYLVGPANAKMTASLAAQLVATRSPQVRDAQSTLTVTH
jgi:hypothetical protein